MTIVITIVKARMEAVARSRTTVAPGVDGHKDVTVTATTNARTTAVKAATELSRVEVSRVDAAPNPADVEVGLEAVVSPAAVEVITAEVNTEEVVNPAPEASTAEALNIAA
jgi:hypothetical protein